MVTMLWELTYQTQSGSYYDEGSLYQYDERQDRLFASFRDYLWEPTEAIYVALRRLGLYLQAHYEQLPREMYLPRTRQDNNKGVCLLVNKGEKCQITFLLSPPSILPTPCNIHRFASANGICRAPTKRFHLESGYHRRVVFLLPMECRGFIGATHHKVALHLFAQAVGVIIITERTIGSVFIWSPTMEISLSTCTLPEWRHSDYPLRYLSCTMQEHEVPVCLGIRLARKSSFAPQPQQWLAGLPPT